MEKIRSSKLIARFVLVWFVLFVGSSIASTLVKPTDMQMVCSGAGTMKLIDTSDKDTNKNVVKHLDCPLCLTIVSPPTYSSFTLPVPSPLSLALHPIIAAHIASLTAPPLPSRGPPNYLQ
jgi:hypothetical protein